MTGRKLLAWFRRPIQAVALLAVAAPLVAQQESVVGTVHNLSAGGPGEIRALNETEVCKFCHVPHSADAPVPLWGHALSTAQYVTPELRSAVGAAQPAPQPDGSSRLCLSCHDGTVALGEVVGKKSGRIAMAGADRLSSGRRGHLGTDLSGSHPISFVMPNVDPKPVNSAADMGLQPLANVLIDPEVKLDRDGKMQCTTCHDPHSDANYQPGRVPRFWVKPTVEGVCLTCHALR